MKRFRYFQYAAAAIASLGLTLPSPASAAEATRTPAIVSEAAAPVVSDVSLGEGGTLSGQVLNGQGNPLAQSIVTVRSAGADVASAITDTQGSFMIRGLHGGVCEVSSAGGSGMFRLWTASASPPSANQGVLIVAGDTISRGQYYGPRGGSNRGTMTNGQAVLGVLVVAGLAGGITAVVIGSQEHNSGS